MNYTLQNKLNSESLAWLNDGLHWCPQVTKGFKVGGVYTLSDFDGKKFKVKCTQDCPYAFLKIKS